MSRQALILAPTERPAPLSVLGTSVTVLGAAEQLGDTRITLQSGPEGLGPPPHAHAWDEAFYVIRGQVLFSCGDRQQLCAAGSFVHVPAGLVHAFRYGPGGGEMLEITGSGSHAVEMFTALDRNFPPGPPNPSEVVRTLAEHGVTVAAA